jgi:hypothetical protein
MTLAEIQQLLDTARAPNDVFGSDVVTGYRRLAGICHPDRFAAGSADAARAAAIFQRLGKWKALAQAPPQTIESPKRSYALTRPLAVGDLCDVHYGISGGTEYVVKIPRIMGGNNLLAKEREVLEQLIEQSGDDLYGEYFPRPVETFRRDRQRINTFRWRDGFYTAEQIFDRYPGKLDGRHLAWMFQRMLEAVGYAHSKGWIHGAIVPPHLMFHAENHGLQLVGWIHAQRPHEPLRVVPARFKDWYPPECRRKDRATPSMDIYLAAKTLVYLAGGNPSHGAMPGRIPGAIRRFVRGCLFDSPGMRPRDAWELHAEFSDLLDRVYGPPKYHHLEMP